MTIKIPYSELPEAKKWKDGDEYEIEVTQISHDKTGATFEIDGGEDEDDEQEPDEEEGDESYSRQ